MAFDPSRLVPVEEEAAPEPRFDPARLVPVDEDSRPGPRFDPSRLVPVDEETAMPRLPYPDATPDMGPASDIKGAMLHNPTPELQRAAAVQDAQARLSPGVQVAAHPGGLSVTMHDGARPSADDHATLQSLDSRLAAIDALRSPQIQRAEELQSIGASGGAGGYQMAGALVDQAAGAVGLAKRIVGAHREQGDLESGLAGTANDLKTIAAADQTSGAGISRAAGSVAGLVAGGPAGRLGMVAGALRAGSEAYSATLTHTGDEGAALKAAAITAPAMLAYIGAGRMAAGFAGRLVARDAGAIAEGLAQFAGAEAANVGTSAVIRALEAEPGERLKAALPTVESMTADTLFAALHGVGAYKSLGQVVKLRAADELGKRGFSKAQIEAPPIEGEWTKVDGVDGEAPATVLTPAPKPSSPSQHQFESQLATQEGVTRGAPTVVIGTEGTEIPAAYAWAPRGLIQPSHTGATLAPNPAYPLTNTRDYSDQAEKDKAVATRNGWDPRRAITDSPDSAVGPPMVARVIDEQGNATLAVIGGNSRQWALSQLSPEQQAATLAQTNAKAAQFGLEPAPDPDAQLVRHLGTFDFRQPGQRDRLQAMVDTLNPSPGMVQSTAKRAQIATASVPLDRLTSLSMDIAPGEAQGVVRQLIADGTLDRNRTASTAASPSEAQDFVQRLLVNAGFQLPQIAEARNDTRAGNATMRGLIDAATPALVRLRQRGENGVADAIARSFATILDKTRSGIDKLPEAVAIVAAQHELDPAHAPAQAIAQQLAGRIVLDQAGRVQSEPTIEAARQLFAQIEKAVSEHQEGADLFGGRRSMGETVQAGAMVREEPAQYGDSLQTAYHALVQRTGFPAVSIGALAAQAGMPMAQLHATLHAAWQRGEVVLSHGDWSLSDEATRAGAMLVNGDRYLQVRFLPPAQIDTLKEGGYSDSVARYLDANGIFDPARRQAAQEEFRGWVRIFEDPAAKRPYEQLSLGLEGVPAGGGAAVPARRPAQQRAASSVPTAEEEAGARALTALSNGLGVPPEELGQVFEATGGTISSILPRLISLQLPNVDWRGKKIARIGDWAVLQKALRSPYVETFKFAIAHPATLEVVYSAIAASGTLDSATAAAREIINALARLPKLANGKRYQVYEAHNHPSGSPEPSTADRGLWHAHGESLFAAGADLADHIVTDGHTFYSFARDGELTFPAGPEKAPWELVARRDLAKLTATDKMEVVAQALRTSDPQHVHVVYGTTRLSITAIQRLPVNLTVQEMMREIMNASAREGAKFAWISHPNDSVRGDLLRVAAILRGMVGQGAAPHVVDIATPAVESFVMLGLISETPKRYKIEGAENLAVQASLLETLREEGPEYSPVQVEYAKGAHASVPLTGLADIKIVQMPEMVALARELMGRIPDLGRMKPLGYFKPLGNGMIKLDPRIFANPLEAAKVLAHEIGHLISWLPQKDMLRGNLHGHLSSLHKFLKDHYGAANISNKAMREELKAVSKYWRPYDPATISKSHLQYRESASELYADAVSVLFNSPATLKQMAPKFYHEFWRGLDTKPEAKAAVLGLQRWLNRPMMAQLADRAKRIDEMFAKGQVIFEQKWKEREERYKGFRGWLSLIKQGWHDNFAPILDRERDAGKSHMADAARFLFDEHPLASNHVYRWLERMHRTVVEPLYASGFSLDDMGQLIFKDRIANESYPLSERMAAQMGVATGGRSVIANPQGHTPATARLGLLHMRLENGIKGQTLLEAHAARFHDLVYDVMKDAQDAGLLTPEQMTLITQNKSHYAAFVPLEHVDLFIPAGIFPQVGTLKEITNPFVATVSKVITMMRASQHNRAKAKTVEILTRDFPSEIQRAETYRDTGGRENPRPPKERGVKQISLKEAGKWAWHNVPAEIHAMFERLDIPHIEATLRVLDVPFRKFFYPLFISFNPVFQLVRNPLRDARRSYVNLPSGIGFWSVARQLPLIKQIGPNPALDAVREFIKRGKQAPIIAQMIENLAITPGEATFNATLTRPINNFDRLLQQFGVIPPEQQAGLKVTKLPFIGPILKAIETTGRMNELLPKVSAYSLLTGKLGWTPREASFFVRNYTGTPNYSKRGKIVGMANTITPFANVWLRGWSADLELMRHGYKRADRPDAPGKSAASWWFRWAATSGLWTTLKVAASIGLLGLGLKKLFDGISQHYLTNYDVLPLGRVGTSDYDPEGKVGFIPVPKDPTDRVLSAILYNVLRSAAGAAAKSGAFGDALKAANQNTDASLSTALAKNLNVGASDVPGLNPLLKLGGAWSDFLQGQNPVDSYRGSFILSDDQHLVGGWQAVKPMLAWSYNQTGASSFMSYDPKAGMTLEQLGNLPLVNGMIKITDYGFRETQNAGETAERAAAARVRLGMPANVQRLAGEYGFLSRLGADDRTPEQQERYRDLSAWHHQYAQVEQQLRDAKENDLSASEQAALRRDLERDSQDYERK